jgi:signal transduction histidine kinase
MHPVMRAFATRTGSGLPSRWLLPAAAAGWLAAVAVAGMLAAQWRIAQAQARLEEEGRATQRLLSQRADQHDAHFTSLGALVAALPAAAGPLAEVAGGILRFYPRITAIDVVAPGGSVRVTTRAGCDAACSAALAGAAAVARDGVPTLLPHGPGRYLMTKRATGLAVVMEVDAARLLEGAPLSPQDGVTLRLPDGTPLLARPAAAEGPLPLHLVFEAGLGSASQPFPLALERRPSALAGLPWGPLAGFALVAAALAALALGLLRSRRLAREAGRRAELGEQAARLAHAGRVNALGEMASGIAHELNQPLTAILSSSQAALRLGPRAAPGTPEAADLHTALEANVRQARRAGEILARLRGWMAKDLPPPEILDLNATAHGVAELMGREIAERDIALLLDLADPAPLALAERVQVEQVLHNLLRNAAEAVATNPPGAPRRIALSTRALPGGGAEVAVQDTGPGVPPALRRRLFEPFFTTKPDGTGLGLSLCRTLVEGLDGTIDLAEPQEGGARFLMRLPGPPRAARAA